MSILDDNLLGNQQKSPEQQSREQAEDAAEEAAFSLSSFANPDFKEGDEGFNQPSTSEERINESFADEQSQPNVTDTTNETTAAAIAAEGTIAGKSDNPQLAPSPNSPAASNLTPEQLGLVKEPEPEPILATSPNLANLQLMFRLDRDTALPIAQASLLDDDSKQLNIRVAGGRPFLKVLPSIGGREEGKWFIASNGIALGAIDFEDNWQAAVDATDEFVVAFTKAEKQAQATV